MSFTFRAPVPLFHVFDLEDSIAFYVHTLNFQLVRDADTELLEEGSRTWVMLQANDLTLMLQAAYKKEDRPALRDPARMLHHEDTVLYLLCADMGTLCDRLHQRGISTVYGADPFANMNQVFVKDPDGYMLCFQTPSNKACYS